jgi:hypothetical protein
MRPLGTILSFALLAVACTGVAPAPTASPTPSAPATASPELETAAAASPTPPQASPGTFMWEEYHSDDLFFSLQLPKGWTASRTGTAEGEVLRARGGDEGSLLINIDMPAEDVRFEEYVRESLASVLEQNPDALEGLNLPGGRAARVVSPRPDGGVSAIYVFAPRGNHAKWLSFTWDGDQPNPLWQAIAERFNAYSARPIIPFVTPTP